MKKNYRCDSVEELKKDYEIEFARLLESVENITANKFPSKVQMLVGQYAMFCKENFPDNYDEFKKEIGKYTWNALSIKK